MSMDDPHAMPVVLELADALEGLTHIWTGPTAVTTTRGIIAPGDTCGPADFHQEPREARQSFETRNGVTRTIPERPGVDGKAKLAEFEEQGKARKLTDGEIAARKALL